MKDITNTTKISRFHAVIGLAVFISLLLLPIAQSGGGGKSKSSPPPPPPPCPWESPGCFKLGGQKVALRETVPKDFDYYLPENTRCDSKAGGCACYAKPANPGAPPLQKNPDESSAACACIDVADWNTKAQCCGDDELDCGRVNTGVLCSIDSNFEQSQWISSSANFGDIRYVGCDNSEYLSDGITWFKCDNTFWKRTIDKREYICTGSGRESIVECCGDGSCKSRVDGKRLATGQSVNPEKFENEAASTFKFGSTTTQDCKIVKKTSCKDFKNCDGMSFFDFQCAIRQVCSETGQPI